MKAKFLVLLLLMITGFIHIVRSDTTPDIDSVNTVMEGKWVWKDCYGGFAGYCTDLPGPGNQRSVVFSNTDTDSVLFEVYKNDTLLLSGNTIFQYRNTTFNSHWIVDQDVVRGAEELGLDYYIIRKIDSSRVEFMQPCIDCYYYIYEKEDVATNVIVLNNEGNLFVYPNPVTGKLSVSSNNIITGLEIIDLTGKIVFSRNYIPGSMKISVDISHINKGIYFIKSFSYNKSYVGRILKL
ncbi:MAG: T9SS type A sorting domain-containing protein [Bacteroidales bacterium]|nr:MAG: T9SS type A sorting domain-containing protein [Bacteroidales bacterium]